MSAFMFVPAHICIFQLPGLQTRSQGRTIGAKYNLATILSQKLHEVPAAPHPTLMLAY